jgi:AcrR family transcriptional regulator
MAIKTKRPVFDPVEATTRELLMGAAAREFNSVGYHGTDTNKIARAAGFSPQTFYRHFADKVDIFVAVYQNWQATERHAIASALKSAAPDRSIAKAILNHHFEWRTFRASLRLIAVDEPRVRRARADSREWQIDMLAQTATNARRPRYELAGALLNVERLCDAAADREFDDLGIPQKDLLLLIVAAVKVAQGKAS